MELPNGFAGVFERLEVVNQRGCDYDCICPAHEDRNASLVVTVKEDKQILFFCRAGCHWESVITAIGIKRSDCFSGDREPQVQSRIVKAYSYRDEAGKELYQAVRMEPKSFRQRHNVNGKWEWSLNGVRRVPYRLPELLASDRKRTVLIVEGEKDVERLRSLGFISTTCSGGAKSWLPEFGKHLAGRKTAIIRDNDDAGIQHAVSVAGSLMFWGAVSIRIVNLPSLIEHSDTSDYLDNGGTAKSLTGIVLQTPEYSCNPRNFQKD